MNTSTTSAADLAKLLPDAPVLRTRPEDLPTGLTDETARRVLTDIGLPVMDEKGIRLESDYEKFLWELPWTKDIEQPAANGPFFQIGLWMGAEIVIDGPSGQVLRMPRTADESGLDGSSSPRPSTASWPWSRGGSPDVAFPGRWRTGTKTICTASTSKTPSGKSTRPAPRPKRGRTHCTTTDAPSARVQDRDRDRLRGRLRALPPLS
ncbi:SUKH-4 family immunity protein [Streptomyces sp. UG1]|uniref:SUKH-4 family immunity protein n=1 Tax=Streptomyces sp. UG1 TaxID=3417652 RepID=UPI003CF71C4D